MKITLCLALCAMAPFGVAAAAAPQAEVKIVPGKDHIDFLIGGELAARYHIGPAVAKPYFWPLLGPGNVPLTRAWPMEDAKPGGSTDHPHQKSAWFCHGDVIPEGIALKDKVKGVDGVDFWSEAKGAGRIVCTSVGEPKVGRGQGRLTTHNEWRAADGTKILDEDRILTLYDLGKARLLVFDVDLLASVCPIVFGDTKEGSMGVRVNDEIREQKGNGKLTNADGKTTEKEVWGQRSDWCDYSGEVGGKKVGIAIFDDAKNPIRACWHSRGYGLMAANPFGRDHSRFPAVLGQKELVRLPRGEHLRFRYGILLHSGDAAAADVAALYQRFLKLRETP